eukprot:m.42953 g.42953  ORF g.42953 m.42953 type:complete len:294 (+) comp11602_c0_seq2:162-1043(+)
MGKHGKNATANPVFSYHERRKDAAAGKYGTQKARLGTDSLQDVDCCCLTLQPAKMPVITPDGFLYDKQAIMENLLHQKKEVARMMREYERQKQQSKEQDQLLSAAQQRERVKAFESQERSVVSVVEEHFKDKNAQPEAASVQRSANDKSLPSFWLPSLGPEAKETKLKKPSKATKCPMSGKPLKLKDLIPVKFTLADRHSTTSVISRKERYMCPLSQVVLRKGLPCVVLKPSGNVITKESYEKLVKPDMTDPLTGDKLAPSDILSIQGSGTGFAGSGGEKLVAEVHTPAMTVS